MLENHDNDKAIFVGNLHSSVKEEILYELFLQAGPVQKVIIPRDGEGRRRSYGFVRYKHAGAVLYATELLNGIHLYGCPIRLEHNLGRQLSEIVRNGHTVQASESAVPQLWSRQSGHRFQQHTDHSWDHVMVQLPPAPSFAPVYPIPGHRWPLVVTPSSAATLWPWPDCWNPFSNGQSQVTGCTNSSNRGGGYNSQNGKRHKRRENHEKRHRRKRKH